MFQGPGPNAPGCYREDAALSCWPASRRAVLPRGHAAGSGGSSATRSGSRNGCYLTPAGPNRRQVGREGRGRRDLRSRPAQFQSRRYRVPCHQPKNVEIGTAASTLGPGRSTTGERREGGGPGSVTDSASSRVTADLGRSTGGRARSSGGRGHAGAPWRRTVVADGPAFARSRAEPATFWTAP